MLAILTSGTQTTARDSKGINKLDKARIAVMKEETTTLGYKNIIHFIVLGVRVSVLWDRQPNEGETNTASHIDK